MMRDSPFHTSANLIEKVRQNINNRQPPSKGSQEKNYYRQQKRYQPYLQNGFQPQRFPVVARPSLQHISSPKEHYSRPSFQSCRQIEDPSNQYYYEGVKSPDKNPFKDKVFKFKLQRQWSQEGFAKGEIIKRRVSEKPQKLEREEKKDTGQSIFKLQDFEEELNEILKDKGHARELLNLIEKKEQPGIVGYQGGMLELQYQRQRVLDLEFEQAQRMQQYIDFDALREQQLQQVQNNPIIKCKLGAMSKLVNGNVVGGVEVTQTKIFLLSEGEVAMKRYSLGH